MLRCVQRLYTHLLYQGGWKPPRFSVSEHWKQLVEGEVWDAQLIYELLMLQHVHKQDEYYMLLIGAVMDSLVTENEARPMIFSYFIYVNSLLPWPSKKTYRRINSVIFKKLRQVGAAFVWGVMAEKLACDPEEMLLENSDVTRALVEILVTEGEDSRARLFALIALEKLAGTNKILKHKPDLRQALVRIIASALSSSSSTSSSSPSPTSAFPSPLLRQLGFCAQWALNNAFDGHLTPQDPESVSILLPQNEGMSTEESGIRVMLNSLDATHRFKLASTGLELRNDSPTFESVRATFSIRPQVEQNGAKSFYYEVEVFTEGVMQIGWATRRCLFNAEQGKGVGDDAHGVGYDGYRCCVWIGGDRIPLEAEKWKAGDVLGVGLDFVKGLSFWLNGRRLVLQDEAEDGWVTLPPDTLKEFAERGVYPALSLTTFQHVLVNFGATPFRYPPDPDTYCNLNSIAILPASLRRKIHLTAHRSLRLQLLATEDLTASDSQAFRLPQCVICYDGAQEMKLVPCGHEGLCGCCAGMVDVCPFCREPIIGREVVELREEEGEEEEEEEKEEEERRKAEEEERGRRGEEEKAKEKSICPSLCRSSECSSPVSPLSFGDEEDFDLEFDRVTPAPPSSVKECYPILYQHPYEVMGCN
ncbi:uncharacterized protein VTP21DRAFT_5184 [Calcarisporiella thermophila]|uniref:uncharacterized protein n=1 Tax=Calcarisporiella thermophila TaxID=911321 RepID=UPI00374477CC